MKWFFGAKQPNQAKYTIVTSSFRTYVKRPRSLSESIVVAGGDFLEIDFFIVRCVEDTRSNAGRDLDVASSLPIEAFGAGFFFRTS